MVDGEAPEWIWLAINALGTRTREMNPDNCHDTINELYNDQNSKHEHDMRECSFNDVRSKHRS